MTSSAWQVAQAAPQSWRNLAALDNLYLNNDVHIPVASDLAPGTALVRIRAAALNARDAIVIAHDPIYHIPNMPQLSPCQDGAGEIFAVGKDSIWNVGDRVFICPLSWRDEEEQGVADLEHARPKGSGNVQGTLRQFAVLPDDELLSAPSHLTFEEIAALPCAAGTAMSALSFGPLKMKPGMTILTQGTGGVSTFAIQLATAAGCTVISTSSSASKLVQAKALGATHTINYIENPDWDQEVLRFTNGKGVDHVLDVGGSGTIEKSLRAVRAGGLVTCIGFLDGMEKVDVLGPVIMGAKMLRGIFGIYRTHCEALLKLVSEKEIHPLLAEVFEWEDARKAFEKLMNRDVVGKVVVKV